MAEYTTNYNLEKQQPNEYISIDGLNGNFDKIDTVLGSTAKFEKTGGTANAITLTGVILEDGVCKTFIVSSNNNGSSTKINDKPLYKPGTTTAPNLVAGKAVTVWYDATGDCFFIKASAEGDAVAENVLASKKFSNDNDTGLTGTMVDNGAVNVTLSTESAEYIVPKGYHNGLGKVKALITGLIASVIKAGTTVGGILGTFTADATATAGDMLVGKSAYVNGNKVTGSMTNNSAVVITPGTTNQVIPQGYHNGNGYVAGDADLIPSNILSSANIFGIQGAAVVGKKFATGTIMSSEGISSKNFRYSYGGDGNMPYIYLPNILNTLSFTPRFMVFMPTTWTHAQDNYVTFYKSDGFYQDYCFTQQGNFCKYNGNPANLYVPYFVNDFNVTWFAYE